MGVGGVRSPVPSPGCSHVVEVHQCALIHDNAEEAERKVPSTSEERVQGSNEPLAMKLSSGVNLLELRSVHKASNL